MTKWPAIFQKLGRGFSHCRALDHQLRPRCRHHAIANQSQVFQSFTSQQRLGYDEAAQQQQDGTDTMGLDGEGESISEKEPGAGLKGAAEAKKETLDMSKTIDTEAGRLPISPLMDPDFLEARERHRTKKAADIPVSGKPPFHRKLARNPYVHALGTPIRLCPVSRVRLPRWFLQDFQLIEHPGTGGPWWVPLGLMKPEDKCSREPSVFDQESTAPDKTQPSQPAEENDGITVNDATSETYTGETSELGPTGSIYNGTGGGRADGELGDVTTTYSDSNIGDIEAPTKEMTVVQARNRASPTGSVYVLASQKLLQGFMDPVSCHRQGYRRLGRLGQPSSLLVAAPKAQWRPDMDVFLLELMRRRIAEELLLLAQVGERHGRHYIVKCNDWDEIQTHRLTNCVLLFADTKSDAARTTTTNQPSLLATTAMKHAGYERKVAVYNLDMLLGEKHVGTLRQECEVMRDGNIFVLTRQRAMEMTLRLWKLQGYLAT